MSGHTAEMAASSDVPSAMRWAICALSASLSEGRSDFSDLLDASARMPPMIYVAGQSFHAMKCA